ncbi:hypothetical protein scyTo_0006166 [Scyliorhinus torazame]|uniref:Uncharacterized protein n=1 Tax=Scyliorhinus torazame TaxID=75743 RepID=A0A401PG55_SCYTO|nr:hypothetical protein [Scyliorhinus torazame]
MPRIKQVVAETVRDWCARECPVTVYSESKKLTFRIAVSVLLGSLPSKEELTNLFTVFEQLTQNLFSLPVDVPGSGYRKGVQARDKLHEYFEKPIEDMLQSSPEYSTALGILIKSSQEQGMKIGMQELKGFQIPKGWSVMYSIRDTHDTAPLFQHPETFNPDRFAEDQMKGKDARFQYLPFGGGVRRCLGKELAKLTLKILAIELATISHWELGTKTFPKMLMVPVVHPANELKVQFSAQLCNKNGIAEVSLE